MAKTSNYLEEKRNRQNALSLHMVRPMINLPHYILARGKLSHFTNIFRTIFKNKTT